MKAEELWKQSGLTGDYEAWAFSDAPDKLAKLVMDGIKTATYSSYDVCLAQGEAVPKEEDYSVILDSRGDAVCIIQTVKVTVLPFCEVGAGQAYLEGEGDRSLEYWQEVHEEFLRKELASIGKDFNEDALVICEEFRIVWTPKDLLSSFGA